MDSINNIQAGIILSKSFAPKTFAGMYLYNAYSIIPINSISSAYSIELFINFKSSVKLGELDTVPIVNFILIV